MVPFKASFEVYSLFEKASGSKLNQSKSKGLWLGGWSGPTDPPVALDWSSVKIKALGVFVGVGDLEEGNWQPRITAVDNILKSWHARSLSFRDKSLVINALALSRIWYVASLIHMPPWVLRELSALVFSFFWSRKRELVSRSVVIQPSLLGGFSVVDVKFKVWSLLGQWVKRFASSPSGWVSFMSFWFKSRFDASPLEVFSDPVSHAPSLLPPFYKLLLIVWQELGGSFSLSRYSLVFGSLCPHFCSLVACMTTKSSYMYLLSKNVVQPHCVMKFASTFGCLHWPTTWRSLSFFDLDCQVIDLNWEIVDGVLYTTQHLVSFGLPVPLSCFCGSPVESLEHLFFPIPLFKVFCVGFSPSCFPFLRCALLFYVIIFCLVSVLMSCEIPLVSLPTS